MVLPPPRTMKILIIDDHSLFRAGLKLLLQRLGDEAEVLEADGVRAAMALATRHPDFDLILLDLQMPDGHGLDGLAELRARFPATSVLMLSAVTGADVIAEGRAKGAQGFVAKTVSAEEMLAAVQRVLRGELHFPRPAQHWADLDLTLRQREVLTALCRGLTNKEIARDLAVSENTIRSHVAVIFRALGVNTRTEAAIVARRHGLC